eukprot:3056472-Amphidinium_carterae.1
MQRTSAQVKERPFAGATVASWKGGQISDALHPEDWESDSVLVQFGRKLRYNEPIVATSTEGVAMKHFCLQSVKAML